MLPDFQNTKILFEKIKIQEKTIHNRIVFQPMEGCDANTDGAPSAITAERYLNFARSGAGIIWMEAVAVVDEGRANPRQLFLNATTADAFKKLVYDIKNTCVKENGYEPVIIIQATHSGRYSKPYGDKYRPLIAYNNPLFEETPIDTSCIVSDDYLMRLEDVFTDRAKLAANAGFDGIDIKSCHRYLGSELLSAYTRKGRYGGDFENRTRFLTNCVNNIRAISEEDFIVTTRLNMYDGFPYPYGFGVTEKDKTEPNFAEGVTLLEKLKLPLVNISIGNPYVNPEVNRPSNSVLQSIEKFEAAVSRLLMAAKAASAVQGTAVVCSGLSGLKARAPYVAAGAIKEGYCHLAGFGRMTFAYPDFVKDIQTGLASGKCCLTCGKCSELMRAGSMAGCVIRNKFYLDLYQKEVINRKL